MIEWRTNTAEPPLEPQPLPVDLRAETADGWKLSVVSATYGSWFYVSVKRQVHGVGTIYFSPLDFPKTQQQALRVAEELLMHARTMVKENHDEASDPHPHHCGTDSGHLRLGDHEELHMLRQAT